MSNQAGRPDAPLGAKEALLHIRTLGLSTHEASDMEIIQEHIEMILALVDKALPRRRRTDNHCAE